MKKFFLTFLAALPLVAMAQSGELKVKGQLKGMGDRIVYYVQAPDGKWSRPDTVALQADSRFSFAVPLDGISTMLFYGLKMNGDKPAMVSLNLRAVAVPGETLELNGALGNYTVSGTGFYADYGQALATTSLSKEIEALSAEAQKMQKDGVNGDTINAIFSRRYQDLQKRREQAVLTFINEHPSSEASLALLSQLEADDFDKVDGKLAPELKTGRFKHLYDAAKSRAERTHQINEARKVVADGKPAPLFTLNDPAGKPLSLESLRGKYVVLDFWGSWCGWCIKGFPEMKKAYDKYKDRLEILGIDCGDTETKWKDALAKYDIPWKHVRSERKEGVTPVETTYAVSGYPTKVIIDPQGKIVRTVVGEDPKFYTYLDELFK